jgi:signal transduction histidine kinase
MKRTTLALLLVFSFSFVFSQSREIDSLRLVLRDVPGDAARFQLYEELRRFYAESDRDSALYYIEQTITLAKGKEQNLVTASALSLKAYQLTQKGNYRDALKYLLQANTIAQEAENEKDSWLLYRYDKPGVLKSSVLADIDFRLGLLMAYTQNYEQAILQLRKSRSVAILIGDKELVASVETAFSRVYIQLNKLDSALIFANSAEQRRLNFGSRHIATVYWYEGNIHFLRGEMQIAKSCYWRGVKSGLEYQNLSGLARNYFALTKLYLTENEKDSSLFYALKTLEITKVLKAQTDNDPGTAYENLYLSYLKRNQLDSAFKYQGLALVAKDSSYLGRIKSLAEFQELTYQEQLRLKQLEKEKETYQSKLKQYALLTGLGVLFLVAFILYRNNRQKQKANVVLYEEKDKVESTLAALKSTQSQLIQSEKMASLGELTAGIAHEIQNPLNFVNNFSEVSNELIAEMNEEIDKGNTDEVKAIASDIKQNLEKINHHGKRADAIVKGMLQHSRTSGLTKEPTDINKLADEYLRLAYHGLRAKDNSFNATLQTDFDETIGDVSIIPQDIGRVLLNIINNAFHAVDEKKKSGVENYEPTVLLSTKKESGNMLISIKDNGNGIPQKILDKIFQPFFTTKPTGQGTGLGLSLSYDIVKAHGGELRVETIEGKGSRFIIQLSKGKF